MEGILMVCFLLVEEVLSVLKSSEGRHCGAEDCCGISGEKDKKNITGKQKADLKGNQQCEDDMKVSVRGGHWHK